MTFTAKESAKRFEHNELIAIVKSALENETTSDGRQHLLKELDELLISMKNEHGINGVDWTGRTILHHKAKSGNFKIVKSLFSKGAEMDARDLIEYTPLIVASRYNHTDMCKDLINHGADISAVGKDGRSALYYASLNKNFGLIEFILNASKGAGVSIAEFVNGYYSNEDADINRLDEVIQMFPHDSFNISSTDHRGYSALHYAAKYAALQVVNKLLENNANASLLSNINDQGWRDEQLENLRLVYLIKNSFHSISTNHFGGNFVCSNEINME